MIRKNNHKLNKLIYSLWAARSAKVLCSAIFVSGRDSEETLKNSVTLHSAFPELSKENFTKIEIDDENKEVSIKINDGPTRTAKFYGDQGCIILPLDSTGIFFSPVKVETTLPDPMTMPWPMGDVLSDEPLPLEIDQLKLKQAMDAAFENPDSHTTAFLVLYKGRLIGERYDLGVNKDTQLESWSMGKSITSTLIGVLIQDGHFGLMDPAPVPKWHVNGDPRAKIRVADLLRMSSGLKFSHATEKLDKYEFGVPDHLYVYCGAIDVFQFCISRPLEHPPNTVGRYRNVDPLTLGFIIKKTVTEMGEEYLTWPQKALFDRIGIRKQVLETDPYGNFIMTGFNYGTPRNWARLGFLYLQDGVSQGKRILPEGFTEFVSTPAPAWKIPDYGGLFRINSIDRWKLPRDAFFMSGAGGQHVIIVPSYDLVIVRMGHRSGIGTYVKTLNNALEKLIASINLSK